MFGGAGESTLGSQPSSVAAGAEKMPHQQRDILAPIAQGRQVDANDVKAVEEVLAKTALSDEGFQILVGGGDDAHIHLDRGEATDTIELAVGQDPQQAGLEFRRHVADLIEEEGAAIGLLEAPLAPGLGAR